MRLAKIVGTVVSTAKDTHLTGQKLMLCAPCGTDGKLEDGEHFVAVDTVGAGVGEIVLVATGSAARVPESTRSTPTDVSIVSILDSIQAGDEATYVKVR